MLGATLSILLLYVVVIICVWVLPGIYVYRDAKSRGMQAVLWTLIAVLTPSLIGFIIYLLVRGSYSNLRCPGCGEAVKEQYVVCPGCGKKLRAVCSSCSAPVEAEWKVCPWCAAPLPSDFPDVSSPIRRKDRGLGKILAAVILIPLFLFVVLLLNMQGGGNYQGVAQTTGMCQVQTGEYLQECEDPQVEAWFQDSGLEYDAAYVLKYEEEVQGQVNTQYLIYLPLLSRDAEKAVGTSTGLFGCTVRVELKEGRESGGDSFLWVESQGDTTPKLKLFYNGKKVRLIVTEAKARLKSPKM
ncbi:MAG: zinc ribbon domain-containing protein [Lachnospiraceae bacterium]|nr:zinc ribbon domain-containing protein [Lachnospiraceae bacterium]MCI9134655.1 zinc ribbon domain-containing protein [Lachnospiraceae bacterium]